MAAELFPPSPPVPAADVAFIVVFGAFVVAFAVLSVITVTWALRRDRAGRVEWVRRRQEEQIRLGGEILPPDTNGHRALHPPGPPRAPNSPSGRTRRRRGQE